MKIEILLTTIAEQAAARSLLDFKHACIIATRGGQILACGINKCGRYGHSLTCHAEMDAFHRLKWCYQGTSA